MSHQPDSRRWWALTALVLTSLAVGFDVTILNLALPSMAEDLHADNVQLQWFVTVYTLVLAAGMIPAGMLGDRLGRKRTLLAALVIFGAGSLAAAYAPSTGIFIAARAVLGLGAALIMPTMLALIPAMFTAEERPKAIGTLAGASLLAFPIGPVLGGWLLNHFWWGSVFLINIPVVVLAFLAVAAWLPESRQERGRRIDVGGVVLSSAALTGLTYGLIEIGERGWTDAAVFGPILGGTAALGLFVVWERRTGAPLVDLALFGDARFTVGTALATLVNFTMFGVLFVLPQYFQANLRTDAMGSSLRLLPLIGGLLIGMATANRLSRLIGPRLAVGVGFVLLAGGLFWGATTGTGSGTGWAAAWTAMYGLGLGCVLPTAMDAALGTLSPGTAGVGAAVNQSIRTLGGSFGAAVLGSILTSAYRAAVPEQARESVFAGLAAARSTGSAALEDTVRSAFVHALDLVLATSGGLGLLGVVLALAWLPGKPERPVRDEAMGFDDTVAA
ncbi:DHA2 family efflux MFS transporter permease subunit [Nonomuraea sp. 3-1Str]|uniref:DHA2 family efflux MFS transporter permease subunit n=1 Tax=Nonomuraea sp. 3-1Str TaxID=2929801 RepID=UPI002865E0FD|nr:DHA2 family efflux MFS transporter permease subunit [Nonomuraea sp. 3-1Str]MDR8412175.1 DHA2 family efflux MFS transporter permease subunit [Nonomuraea sp. 3-1Str]